MNFTADKSEDPIKALEAQLLEKAADYLATKNAQELVKLIQTLKSSAWIEELPKAKMTKLLRQLLDSLASIPNSFPLQRSLVNELIEWTKVENRVYLKLYLETRLVGLNFELGQYQDALTLITQLLKELRRLDDKMMLLEVQLLESRVQFALKNIAKSKACLTAARTSANAIYCPPVIQAGLDMQSGILHAEEKDFKTAFSYFYETFEGLSSISDSKAKVSLKYMLLCKIMMGLSDEVPSLVHTKTASQYTGRDIDAMVSVAKAYENRSLKDFEATLKTYDSELNQDTMVRSHLSNLYDSLLEKNLIKLIEPYSRVELSHLALLIQLPVNVVEAKLSQMILDKCFNGMLDQGSACLIILDEPAVDSAYKAMLATIKQMENVVDSLYQKAAILG